MGAHRKYQKEYRPYNEIPKHNRMDEEWCKDWEDTRKQIQAWMEQEKKRVKEHNDSLIQTRWSYNRSCKQKDVYIQK